MVFKNRYAIQILIGSNKSRMPSHISAVIINIAPMLDVIVISVFCKSDLPEREFGKELRTIKSYKWLYSK